MTTFPHRPHVQDLGGGDAEGAGRDNEGLDGLWGKEKADGDQGCAGTERPHGADVAVLIEIAAQHAISPKADAKGKQDAFEEVGGEKLHADEWQY